MPPKSEKDHIVLLLAIIEHAEKPKWDDIAKDTGLYKSGKFVLQAYKSVKDKYADDVLGILNQNHKVKDTKTATNPNTVAKKRTKNSKDDGDATNPRKRTKTQHGEEASGDGGHE